MSPKRRRLNTRAVARLVEDNVGLVVWVVGQMGVREDRLLSFDDHVSAGLVGLWHAAQRFDPAAGVKFETFAYKHIRGAVCDGIRKAWRTRGGSSNSPEPAGMLSLDTPVGHRDGRRLTLGAIIPAPHSDAADPGCRLDLADAISRLPEQQRLVITRYYSEGGRLRECLPGRTTSRASQVRRSALRQLREMLG